MTTRDKGITLPENSDYTNVSSSAGYKVTDTANDYTSLAAWNYGAGYIEPLVAVTTGANPPTTFVISAPDASASLAHIGGEIALVAGQGSVGDASGNILIEDTNGDGGAWNTTHLVLGVYHLWFDTSSRLRIKASAPANATDGQVVGFDLSGSAVYDAASIADGDSITTTIGVAGAVLGDFAIGSFSLDLAGLQLTAYVSIANIVTVVLSNQTGGAVDLASGTLRVKVIKQ